MALWTFSDKYQAGHVKAACQKFLAQQSDYEVCLKIAVWAGQHHCPELQKIRKSASKVVLEKFIEEKNKGPQLAQEIANSPGIIEDLLMDLASKRVSEMCYCIYCKQVKKFRKRCITCNNC